MSKGIINESSKTDLTKSEEGAKVIENLYIVLDRQNKIVSNLFENMIDLKAE